MLNGINITKRFRGRKEINLFQFTVILILGGIVSISIVSYSISKLIKKRKAKYGFKWYRYDLRDWTHKYVGDFLYVCERVPFLDNKVENLPKTKGEKV